MNSWGLGNHQTSPGWKHSTIDQGILGAGDWLELTLHSRDGFSMMGGEGVEGVGGLDPQADPSLLQSLL